MGKFGSPNFKKKIFFNQQVKLSTQTSVINAGKLEIRMKETAFYSVQCCQMAPRATNLDPLFVLLSVQKILLMKME